MRFRLFRQGRGARFNSRKERDQFLSGEIAAEKKSRKEFTDQARSSGRTHVRVCKRIALSGARATQLKALEKQLSQANEDLRRLDADEEKKRAKKEQVRADLTAAAETVEKAQEERRRAGEDRK